MASAVIRLSVAISSIAFSMYKHRKCFYIAPGLLFLFIGAFGNSHPNIQTFAEYAEFIYGNIIPRIVIKYDANANQMQAKSSSFECE